MRAARPGQAGLTLIEVMIVLAITLVIGGVVYRVTRSSWNLYNTQTHQTERGFSGLRSIDDMAVEIARAGYGLGADAAPVFPGTLAGVRATDAITLRSNPGGVAGVLQENLVEKDQLVPVDGAPLFVVGDAVLLVDEEGTLERAQVTKITPEELAFRSLNGPGGQIENQFRPPRRSRPQGPRGRLLSEEGQHGRGRAGEEGDRARPSRHSPATSASCGSTTSTRRGGRWTRSGSGPGLVPGGVRITLGLLPNPPLPRVTVPPLSLRVSLEPQSATVAFDAFAFHRVGVAGVIGQDPASAERKIGMHGWRKSDPRF